MLDNASVDGQYIGGSPRNTTAKRPPLMGLNSLNAPPAHENNGVRSAAGVASPGHLTRSTQIQADANPNRLHFKEVPLEQYYEVCEELGSGQFAVVRLVRHRTTGERYAAKYVKKRRYTSSRRGVPRQHIEREMDMLQCVGGHDNVIELHEVYETPMEVILVLELVEGGELFDHVCRHEYLEEAEAAAFIRQILHGLRHLHSRHVVHLDIKPENIMLRRKGEAHVKIIDFGLSRRIHPGQVVKDMMGTPEFVAPEVVNYEPLSAATDMWALGVVCYILLSGGSPFLGRNREETFCNISGVNYHFSANYFSKTSAEAKDFISRLFVRDVRKRATVEECLRHPWIAGSSDLLNDHRSSLINVAQIRAFKLRVKWQKAIGAVIYCVRLTCLRRYELRRLRDSGIEDAATTIGPEPDPSESSLRLSRIPFDRQPTVQFHFDEDDIITSAILVACEDGDAGALEQLTNVHRIHLNVANTLGETPMHVAAGAGHEHLIAFLTRRGCKVAVADKRGDTPIFWAARNGHANVIRCLLAHMSREATANATKNGKASVVDPEVARLQSRNQMTSINCVNGVGLTMADLDVTNTASTKKAELFKSRESALHVATRYAQMEAVLALLELGIDADIEDEHGETVLHIASWHGYALLLSILCRFSPQMDLVNKDGETALHCAATRGHIECVNSLLEGGAPPDAQDQDGQTALHLALRRGHIDIALLLITKGCRLDVQDGTGDSALHIASQQGLCSCVQTLCHLGAPVDLQNQQALTPLHLAAKEGHIEVVRCLCLASANIHLKSKDGLTAEILALSQDHSQINSLLSRMKSDQTREQFIEQLQPLDTPLRRIKLKFFGHSGVGKTRLLQALQTTPTHSSFNTLMDGVRRWTSGSGGGGGATSSLSFDLSMQSPRPPQQSPHHHLPPYNPSRSFQQQQQSQQQHRESVASTISAITDKTASSSGSSSAVNNNGGGGTGTNKTDSSEETAKTTPTSATPSSSLAGDNGGGISTSHLSKNIPGLVNAKYTKGIDVQNMSFPNCGEFSCWEFGGYESYHIAYDHFVGNSDCIHVVVLCASDPTEVQYKQVLYWMNFLKGRVTPSEPISHCGVVSRRSKVLIVGTAANPQLFPERTPEGEWSSSDAEAMMQTIRLRFGTHFDICERMILVDENNASCPGMKSLRVQLRSAKESIVVRLQRPLALLEMCVEFLNQLRKRYATFPVITWPHFVNVVRCDLNPLASDSHCRQLIQQLQLIGEVVYLRDEASELDYVVLTPEWLGTHLLGTLLSFQFLTHCRSHGRYRASDFQSHFPEINEPADLLHILDTLQLCAVGQVGGVEPEFEFPAYILGDPPKDVWINLSELPSPASAASSRRASREQFRRASGRASSLGGVRYIYGGMRILPMRGMERSLQSTFPRIQVALRRSMNDFQDPMDAELHQWYHCSKMCSGQMEALIRLLGDAVEIQLRGPADTAASCVYFLEDLANLVEQTASEVAPGICLERHFLSPKHLKEHSPNPPSFYPEQLMQMQQKESLVITNSDGEEEQFTDVVCFGSREVAAALTLGIDVSVSQLQLASRCELAALLDPPDAMGRDWSILAVKLNLTDQLPEVDSTGQSLSRTDQLLAEWALQSPDTATVGKLCTILEEMDRCDARDVLYRTVPLYLFAPLPSYDANTLQPNSPVPLAPNGHSAKNGSSGGKQEGGGKSELHDSGLVVSSSSANSSSLVVDPVVSSASPTVSAKQ